MARSTRRQRSWAYVPVEGLAGRPHVMVDGAPRPGTALTLSHWPGTPTPKALWADLSAQIVLNALDQPDVFPKAVTVATVDHKDVDGVVSVALLVHEGLAETHGALLVEAARVGDFDVVTDSRAAMVAFALGALNRSGTLAETLEALPSLAGDPAAYETLWGPELSAYQSSVDGRDHGWWTLEEMNDLDLAVVTVRGPGLGAAVGTSGQGGQPGQRSPADAVHRAAVHSATECLRVATVAPGFYELRYRYESWVRLASYRPRLRVDLGPLAEVFNAAEVSGARWEFEGAGALAPALRLVGGARSSLDPRFFVETVCAYLEQADAGPAAWDPYVE